MRISDWSSDVCSSDLPAPRAFDLLLLDAPYGTGAGSVALDKLTRLGWVGPESWVSIETAEKEAVEIAGFERSEEHTSELQSLMRISYAVFCLKKKKQMKQQYAQYRQLNAHMTILLHDQNDIYTSHKLT